MRHASHNSFFHANSVLLLLVTGGLLAIMIILLYLSASYYFFITINMPSCFSLLAYASSGAACVERAYVNHCFCLAVLPHKYHNIIVATTLVLVPPPYCPEPHL